MLQRRSPNALHVLVHVHGASAVAGTGKPLAFSHHRLSSMPLHVLLQVQCRSLCSSFPSRASSVEGAATASARTWAADAALITSNFSSCPLDTIPQRVADHFHPSSLPSRSAKSSNSDGVPATSADSTGMNEPVPELFAMALLSPTVDPFVNLAIEDWLFRNVEFPLRRRHDDQLKAQSHLGTRTSSGSTTPRGTKAKAKGNGGNTNPDAPPSDLVGVNPMSSFAAPFDFLLFCYVDSPSVVIGRNQNPFTECNLERMQAEGVPFLRRQSGGGTVYHDEGNLNFCVLTTRQHHDPQANIQILTDFLSSSKLLSSVTGVATAALFPRELFQTSRRHDLFLEGKKLTGSAMKIGSHMAYHHFTLLVDSERNKIGRYLTEKQKIRMTSVERIKGVRAHFVNVDNANGFDCVESLAVSSVPSPVTTLAAAVQQEQRQPPEGQPHPRRTPQQLDGRVSSFATRIALGVAQEFLCPHHLKKQRQQKEDTVEGEGDDGVSQQCQCAGSWLLDTESLETVLEKEALSKKMPSWLYTSPRYNTVISMPQRSETCAAQERGEAFPRSIIQCRTELKSGQVSAVTFFRSTPRETHSKEESQSSSVVPTADEPSCELLTELFSAALESIAPYCFLGEEERMAAREQCWQTLEQGIGLHKPSLVQVFEGCGVAAADDNGIETVCRNWLDFWFDNHQPLV